MASVFYQILYWLKNLTGLILMAWLESVKNVKIFPRQNFPLYGRLERDTLSHGQGGIPGS